MSVRWTLAVLGVIAAGAAFALPTPAAVTGQEALFARVAVCAVIGLAFFALTSPRAASVRVLSAVVAAASCAVLLAILVRSWAADACVADFQGRPVVVGFELREYARHESTLANAEILFDAGGEAARAWTGRSIGACREALVWSGPLVVLFAALGAGALRLMAARRRPAPPAATADRPIYDAFISYRHVEPDRSFALDVATRIEREGFRVAIDARDFKPNEPVIAEQERCIRQSRFTLCVVSPRYVDSGYCADEAIVSTTLGLNERRRRVVPLTYERAELPGWMQGLVGIDFSDPAAFVDPYTRVFDLLRADAGDVRPSAG
jgi:hypothetical protein